MREGCRRSTVRRGWKDQQCEAGADEERGGVVEEGE